MNATAAAALGAGFGVGLFLLWWGTRPVSDVSPRRRRQGQRLPLTRTELIRAGIGVVLGLLLTFLQGWLIMIAALPVAFILLPRVLTPPTLEDPERMEAIAKWVRSVHSMLTAHGRLNEALIAASRGAAPAIAPQTRLLADRLTTGWDTTRALYQLGVELDTAVSDFVILALIAASTGSEAGLSDALAAIDIETMEEVQARRDIGIERRKAFKTVRMVTLISIFVMTFVIFMPMGQLYRTPVGQVALAGFLGLYAVVLVDIRRTAEPRPPRRFLVVPEGVQA